MSPPQQLAGLLGSAVRIEATRIGEVAGVFLDASAERVIGLDVVVGGVRRFLPWVAAGLEAGVVRVASALLLVDGSEAYERLGAVSLTLSAELEHLRVATDGRLVPCAAAVSVEGPAGIRAG